jgi:MFS family permease
LKTFSTAFGVWYFCYLGTLFVSPIIVGRIYDGTGSYRVPLLIMIGGILAAIAVVFATPVSRFKTAKWPKRESAGISNK